MGSTSRARRGLLGWIAALVTAVGCSSAIPRGDGVIGSGDVSPLRVATSGDYAPFSVWSEGEAEPRGFSSDVARAFARDRGLRIEWIRLRWPELQRDVESERFDLALSGITIRPDRSLAGRFSLPLTLTGAVALVREESALRTGDDLDRPGIRIAVNQGGHLERVARTLFAKARIEALADNASVPERLASNRAEAVLSDDLEAPHWQAVLPRTRAIGPLTHDRKAAYFPIGRTELARDFDRWLLRSEQSGELARLRRHHGLRDTRTAEVVPALLASLDERLSLMPAVALAKQVLGLPVEDASQEERVHAAARNAVERAAREFGREPPAAADLQRFVDAQLRAARFLQVRELAELERAIAATGSVLLPSPETARKELDTRVRPAIASISERIAWLLVASTSSDPEYAVPGSAPRLGRESVSTTLADHALPAEIEAELHDSLAALLKPPQRAREASPARPSRAARRDITPNG